MVFIGPSKLQLWAAQSHLPVNFTGWAGGNLYGQPNTRIRPEKMIGILSREGKEKLSRKTFQFCRLSCLIISLLVACIFYIYTFLALVSLTNIMQYTRSFFWIIPIISTIFHCLSGFFGKRNHTENDDSFSRSFKAEISTGIAFELC